MGGAGAHSILLSLVARCLETIDACIWYMFVFMSVVVTVWDSVAMFVVQLLSWTTQHALSTDHLPLIDTINIRHTDYNKTDRLSPTTRKLTGHNLRKIQSLLSLRPPYPPTDTLPTYFYKHHPDGRQAQHTEGQDAQQLQALTRPHSIQNNPKKQHKESTCDSALKLLNEEIFSNIQKSQTKHMEGTLRCTLGSQTQHAHSK